MTVLKPAAAQLQNNNESAEASVPERQSVLQRARPDYDAPESRLEGFILRSTLETAETWNSNVYSSPTKPIGDFETVVSPMLRLDSDWSVHALGLMADADLHRYLSRVSENDSDYTLASNGRLDIYGDTTLTFLLSDRNAHEPRTSPDSVADEKSPIAYRDIDGHAVLSHETYRIGLRVEGNVEHFLYSDGVTQTGTAIAETYRDRYDYLLTPRLSYEIAPGYHAFVKMPLNEHDYDNSTVGRNSHGTEIDAGTAIDLGTVVTGEVFAGMLHQYYQNPAYRPLSGISYGGNCLWNFSALSSFKLTLTRNVQETTLTGASADMETSVSASIEHELHPDLLVAAGAGLIEDDFVGTTRRDSSYQGSASLRYLLTRYLYLEVKGLYQTRQSNADLFDYRQDTISVTIHAQH